MESKNPRLLVVEDNPANQKVVLALVDRYGFSAVLVSTCREALETLIECEGFFSAILMDCKMPEVNGIECTKVIRQIEEKRKQRTPIIGVTAYASDGARQDCIDAGMDDYLSKPYDPEDFRKMLLKWTYNPDRPNLRILPNSEQSP